jgi:hypothetical protein
MQDEILGVEFEDVLTLHETAKAVLCNIAGEDHWVPKSQILIDSEVQGHGDQGVLRVTEWWAIKIGWNRSGYVLHEKGEK